MDAHHEGQERRSELERGLGPAADSVERSLDSYRSATEPDASDLDRLRKRVASGEASPVRRRATWWVLGVAAAAATVAALMWGGFFQGPATPVASTDRDAVAKDDTEAGRDSKTSPFQTNWMTVVAVTGQLFAESEEGLDPVVGSTRIESGTKLRAGDGGCEVGFGPGCASRIELAPKATVKVVDTATPCFEIGALPARVVAKGDVDFVVHGERFRCKSSSVEIVPCCGSSERAATVNPMAPRGVMTCGAVNTPQIPVTQPFRDCKTPQLVGTCEKCGMCSKGGGTKKTDSGSGAEKGKK